MSKCCLREPQTTGGAPHSPPLFAPQARYKNPTVKYNIAKTVVDEGVEDIETLELLKQMGCDEIQGFYYAKPMRKIDLENFMQNKKVTVHA